MSNAFCGFETEYVKYLRKWENTGVLAYCFASMWAFLEKKLFNAAAVLVVCAGEGQVSQYNIMR